MKLVKNIYKKKINKNFIDNINEKKLRKDLHYKKTLDLWGLNNHKNNKNKYVASNTHIEKVISEFPISKKIENFLEIGCGDGIDLRYLIKNYKIKNFYAIEIGDNIYNLYKKTLFKKIHFCRGDALNLIYKNNSFDLVYSYGVFHHTKNLKKCLIECKRVLKKNGILIFYNYKKHGNIIKKIGIYAENILLNFFQNFKYNQVKIFCYIISPLILLIFSYPSKLLKLFGNKSFYKKFPLWWGMVPNDIILDLTDRIYAPINIRMTKNEITKILSDVGFAKINVKEVRDGLFIKVIK